MTKHARVEPLRRWVIERDFAWMTRFRGLAMGFERQPKTVTGLHSAVISCIMLERRLAVRCTFS